MQQSVRGSLMFVQDSESPLGLIALDFERQEQILFSMKLHPVLCFGQDEYVHLSNLAPISIETDTARLISQNLEGKSQEWTYVLNLENSFQLKDCFSADDIKAVTTGDLSREYDEDELEDAMHSAIDKLKAKETPSAIHLLSDNLTIQLVNQSDFEIIAKIGH